VPGAAARRAQRRVHCLQWRIVRRSTKPS
jgi:hypothetical protein